MRAETRQMSQTWPLRGLFCHPVKNPENNGDMKLGGQVAADWQELAVGRVSPFKSQVLGSLYSNHGKAQPGGFQVV